MNEKKGNNIKKTTNVKKIVENKKVDVKPKTASAKPNPKPTAKQNYEFDVLYLGSGHGSFNGAIPLAAKGKKLGVIEAGKIGGTCPNRGCNAKIALDVPVKVKQETEAMRFAGLDGNVNVNWEQNVKHEKEVIDNLPNAIEKSMKDVGISVIHGYGKLIDAHTIDVEGKKYTADKIVIATGAHYNVLNIPGIELAHDGTDFLSLEKQPDELIIIGGGYIALEFASIAAYSGTKVKLLLHHETALRKFYQPFVKKLLKSLEQQGVEISINMTPRSIEKTTNGYTLKTNNGSMFANWILDATGRNPNVEKIGLDEVGVKYDEKGIKVNDHLQTSVSNIYATGDVVDKEVGKLTPTAIFESTYLTKLFLGTTKEPIKYPAVPSAVFTTPRIAHVGVTPDEAKANPDKYDVKETSLTGDWFRAALRENKGDTITIFDKKGYLVGMTEISSEADNAISSILPFIEYHISPDKMNDFIPLFPTLGSETKNHL